MKKIGVIGTGNMGGMLTEILIESGASDESNVWIYNRTKERSEYFQTKFPRITAASQLSDLLLHTDIIFVCVRPGQYESLLESFRTHLSKKQILATITSPVLLEDLETLPPQRVVRTVPSIVNKTMQGPLLLTFGNGWKAEERKEFKHWISHFSDPMEVSDNVLRASSDIVSCGPAFMSLLLERFIYAAVTETAITLEEAEQLAEKMMISYGHLLQQGHFDLRSLREKVNVPGGITGEGIKVIKRYSEGMFEEVFQQTHRKFAVDKQEMIKLLQHEEKS
ncbi:late competence protein ComER [Alteribacillus iranensis]|uniref:Competence protein ComER n=1 Tax=Alteribacillus iranensis TaxID=930128 RepID=A0A1I1Z9Q3_9BACI|nr:late competence protein ComER [Alteribacillus iranensis]SFE28435.1 competence protein ComER [Alteribacillus iranensis]